MTPQQKKENAQINELKKELSSSKLPELKEMLKKNNQPHSGNKTLLVDRISDGQVRGAIPKCPRCAGGNLTYHQKKGNYTCRGYMDDDTFKRCSYDGKATRTPWIHYMYNFPSFGNLIS